MKSLGIPNSERAAVFSFTMGGFGVLHCAACQGHLEVCKYLVEELGGDPNMSGGEGEDQVEGLHQNNQSPSQTVVVMYGTFGTSQYERSELLCFYPSHYRCDTVYGLCSIWRYFHCEVFIWSWWWSNEARHKRTYSTTPCRVLRFLSHHRSTILMFMHANSIMNVLSTRNLLLPFLIIYLFHVASFLTCVFFVYVLLPKLR